MPTRSIPAGAGQPPTPPIPCMRQTVYPRGCGAAVDVFFYDDEILGLSPRVRGSLVLWRCTNHQLGSIPAGAGQPSPSPSLAHPLRVYPRGCGAAEVNSPIRVVSHGLSPRVRGSLTICEPTITTYGSIPAGAGQPRSGRPEPLETWVYPRGCGAAPVMGLMATFQLGLSPRVRGSLYGKWPRWGRLWSIPAGAGQPSSPSFRTT